MKQIFKYNNIMKKHLLFIILFTSATIVAQTISVDGSINDWADIPILSEPGVFPYVKVQTTTDSVFYMIETGDAEKQLNSEASDAFCSDIDADRDETTGQKSSWLHINAGNDYHLTNTMHFFSSGEMVWKWYPIDRFINKQIAEAGFKKEKLETIPDQPEASKISLAENFGIGFRYKIESDEIAHLPTNDYNFSYRNTYSIKERTILTETAGTIELTSSNAYYMPFMKDENIDEYLDFQSGKYSTQNPAHWASWSIDLQNPAKYNVKLTHQCDDGGKIQFFLIDMTSNQLVYSTTDDIWYAKHDTGFAEQTLSFDLDLSAIMAGKYMLKIKNNTTWAANLKVKKLVLENKNATSLKNSIDENIVSLKNNTGNLTLTTKKLCDIIIYDTTGNQIVHISNIKTAKIPLSSGIYIVRIDIEGKSHIRKLFFNNK